MTDAKDLKEASIVLLAQNFNPSIFNPHWLITKGVIKEENIKFEQSSFTPKEVRILTDTFEMIVLQDRLLINYLPNEEVMEAVIQNLMHHIFNLLPEVPYMAMGINFKWEININNQYFSTLNKRLLNEENPFLKYFPSENSLYGINLNNQFLDSLQNFTLQPFINETQSGVVGIFNYHFDVSLIIEKVHHLAKAINDMTKYYTQSKKIMECV